MPTRSPVRGLLIALLLAVSACATEDQFAPPDPSLITRVEVERVLTSQPSARRAARSTPGSLLAPMSNVG